MMRVFHADNVNAALSTGIDYLLNEGIEEQSRNGPVLVAPGPVCTVYPHPLRHVLLSPVRDANPFFHLMESLWMLAGNKDLGWLTFFNSKYASYSDDGLTVWGAYGWRWRSFFGWDQIERIVEELKANPDSRRCVLAMWNASNVMFDAALKWRNTASDDFFVATHGGKDVPCNTQVYVDARGGVLNITVCCRSNDIIWGAYGANAVHFSMLAVYLALRIGIPVGEYRQFSNNFHLYTDTFDRTKLERMSDESALLHNSDYGGFEDTTGRDFDLDLAGFMVGTEYAGDSQLLERDEFATPFFAYVCVPAFNAWLAHKRKEPTSAMARAQSIQHEDWQLACTQWLERRYSK